jgi:hypothetical protein
MVRTEPTMQVETSRRRWKKVIRPRLLRISVCGCSRESQLMGREGKQYKSSLGKRRVDDKQCGLEAKGV